MDFSLDKSTIIWLIAIVAGTCSLYLYIKKLKDKNKLISNRRLVENIPSIISTIGVLGTFYGITSGLLSFNSDDLDTSIPALLDGLKTAFFTSIAGMVCSLIMSKIINSYFDKADDGISDANQAASQICKAVQEMSQKNIAILNALKEQSENQAKNQTAFYRSVGDILIALQTSHNNTESAINSMVILSRSQETTVNDLRSKVESMTLSLGAVEENSTIQTATLSNIQQQTKELSNTDRNISEMLDILSGMSNIQEEISEETKAFGGKLHSEVVEIEDKMDATNQLLTSKFDEFSELLKKSNTEALVEVMKTVTEEFQKQMNSLINKLIQENFDQLNKSVEKLNTWQQENKAMISSLNSIKKWLVTLRVLLLHSHKLVTIQELLLVKVVNSNNLLILLIKLSLKTKNSLMFPTNSKKQQTYQKKIWRNLMNQRKFLMIGFVNNVILWMASNFSLRN